MTNTPGFQDGIEQTELQRLYDEHGLDALLQSCKYEIIPAPSAGMERTMHEVLCCKKETKLFFDEHGDEIALISYVTPAPDTNRVPYLVISRLRVNGVIYSATLFSQH